MQSSLLRWSGMYDWGARCSCQTQQHSEMRFLQCAVPGGGIYFSECSCRSLLSAIPVLELIENADLVTNLNLSCFMENHVLLSPHHSLIKYFCLRWSMGNRHSSKNANIGDVVPNAWRFRTAGNSIMKSSFKWALNLASPFSLDLKAFTELW